MEKIGNMTLYTFEEVKDEVIGKKGTPERDAFDENVEQELLQWRIGEAIKDLRLSQNLTQNDLGRKLGISRAHVVRLENGRCRLTLSYICKVFKVLGVQSAALDLCAGRKIELW